MGRCSAIPGEQGPITANGDGRTNPISPNILPCSFFPPLYMLSMAPCGVGNPYGHLRSSVPAVSPPRLSQPLISVALGKAGKTLGSVQALLICNKNISVLSALCSAQTQNTAPNQPLERELLYPSQNQHTDSTPFIINDSGMLSHQQHIQMKEILTKKMQLPVSHARKWVRAETHWSRWEFSFHKTGGKGKLFGSKLCQRISYLRFEILVIWEAAGSDSHLVACDFWCWRVGNMLSQCLCTANRNVAVILPS